MADPHAHDDYVRGSMEISEQKSTYDLFMVMAKYGSLAIAALLTFLTLWFMPAGNFLIGAGAAVVLLIAGVWFLRSPAKH
ncbi:MAG: aa3-type cytochrome c oxidase subunit IV [Brevundimonas sp.]|nr:MAG: aa3-type cytochrome c oxidase subunit IV [Brevundimonas sp.]